MLSGDVDGSDGDCWQDLECPETGQTLSAWGQRSDSSLVLEWTFDPRWGKRLSWPWTCHFLNSFYHCWPVGIGSLTFKLSLLYYQLDVFLAASQGMRTPPMILHAFSLPQKEKLYQRPLHQTSDVSITDEWCCCQGCFIYQMHLFLCLWDSLLSLSPVLSTTLHSAPSHCLPDQTPISNSNQPAFLQRALHPGFSLPPETYLCVLQTMTHGKNWIK